jgi:hypothetical protein
MHFTDRIYPASALRVFVRFFIVHHIYLQTVAVGVIYIVIDMLKTSDIPCLVFYDIFTLDEIPINNLITTNQPSPAGWADVIKMALVKIQTD